MQRTGFFKYSVLVLISIVFGCTRFAPSEKQQFVEFVYPHLDAANSRWFFFSSACRPFGMINLSPDTELGGAWGSGYRYHTEEVKGFSHVHAWQLSGISVMPISLNNSDAIMEFKNDYYSTFSHETELVKPGYHKLFLDRYRTSVELTATTRVGFHKYSFPQNSQNYVMFQLGGDLGPSVQVFAEFNQVDARTFNGHIVSGKTFRRPKNVPIHFHVELNTDVLSVDCIEDSSALFGINKFNGKNIQPFLRLSLTDHPVLVKVAISYVSVEQAKLNMQAELNHWDFEKVKSEAIADWNNWLSTIKVEGGSLDDQRRFYTDLWHALQGRRIISDYNGKYMDMTGDSPKIKQIALDENGQPKFNHYNSDSFWGAQWTLNTLWHLAYPKVTSEFCNSMVNYYTDGGLIPRGPSGGNYTYVMTGASSTPFIVSAYQKGIRDFDIEKAYEGLVKNHSTEGMMSRSGYDHTNSGSGGVDKYIENGFVPYPYKVSSPAFHKCGASQTLEYAYQDWTLAQMAKALGKSDDYKTYMQRSQNYRNVFDPESGYMRPKDEEGKWKKDFNPADYGVGFVESNSYQATWFVPHDYNGLAELMGGKDKAIEKLNWQFAEAQKYGFTSGKKHADETGEDSKRIPINYGNQPSIETAFIFNELGAPWFTQKWSRLVVDSVYTGLSPDFGYNGDEDQGLMGSLAVLMKIGLFQLNGGCDEDPVYQIGSPIFDKIEIKLSDKYYSGKTFVIKAINNSKNNVYLQSIKLNGHVLNRYFLRHSEIINGGILELTMGSEPKNDQ
ncbi:MAG: GH92 family glycosyl hydrolase [Prolixibacteraceae bacterium]